MPHLSMRIGTSTKQTPWRRFPEACDPFEALLTTKVFPVAESPFVSGSLARQIDDTLTEIQRIGIHVEKPNEVYEYLLQVPDMILTTKEVSAIASRGLPNAQLTLKLYRDPEVKDEHLVLYARFRDYDESVMEKIREIRRNYRELLLGKRGWLLLTTDFEPVE